MVWRTKKLYLFQVKNLCCVWGEFIALNAYKSNLSYQIKVQFIFVYRKSLDIAICPFFDKSI